MQTTPSTHKLKNGEELIIRDLLPEDAEQMISFMKQVDTESPFLAREIGEFNYTPEQERQLIEDTLKDEHQIWIIGEVNGRLIANSGTFRYSGKQRYKHRALISIVVMKEYWGLGVGKALMQASIDWCRSKGYEQLELDTLCGNERSIGLYKSLGFEITGTKKHAIKYLDGTYSDEYVMWLSLK